MLKKAAKITWRIHWHLTVWLIVAVFLLWLALVWIAHSAQGSRWLLEKLVASQKLVQFEVIDGNLIDGLRLKNFQFSAKTFHLKADELDIGLIWAGLLEGSVYIEHLQGDGVQLVLTAPPSHKPTHLKYINLPFRLQLADGELTRAAIIKHGLITPVDVLRVQQASWLHTDLTLQLLEFRHPQFSTRLKGAISFRDHYPLRAQGDLQARFWQEKQLPALKAGVDGDLAALHISLLSNRAFPVAAQITADVIEPDMPYTGFLRWGNVLSPWFAEQEFASRHGQVLVRGDKHGLVLSAVSDLKNKVLPQGEYRAYAETDWHHIKLLPLQARTLLGGVLTARGEVSWPKPGHLAWDLASLWSGVDLSRQWPKLAPYVPVLTGQLQSKGETSPDSSTVKATAQWQNREQWQIGIGSKGRFWHLEQPQTLNFNWQHLERRLPGVGAIASPSGKLYYQGVPEGYQLTLDSQMTTARTPAGHWQLSGHGDKQQLKFSGLDYLGEAGHVQADGVLNWQHGIDWNARINLEDFKTGFWLPAWPAQLSGSSQSQGHWQAGRRQLQFGQTQLQGQLKDLPFNLSGEGALTMPEQGRLPPFQAHQLQVGWGQNHVALEGALADGSWDLTVDNQLPDLAQLDPRLQGQLNGVVVLHGPEKTPAVSLNLNADQFRFGDISADSLTLSGIVPALGDESGFLQMTARNLSAANRVIPDLGIVLEGTRADHQLTWQMLAEPVVAEGTLHGGLDSRFNWSGDSQTGTVKVGDFLWELNQPFAVHWLQVDKQLTMAAHCWLAEQAELCSADELSASPNAVHARLGLKNLEISRLSAVFPEGLAWQGALEGNAELNWRHGDKPHLALELVTSNGAVGLSREDEEPLTFPYHQLRLAANSEDDGNLKFRFDMQAPNMGQGYVEARINPDDKPYNINGAMVLEKLNLAILKPFMPGMSHLAGEINLAGGLSGPLTGPDFYGEFSLNEGEMTAKNAPIDLTHTNIHASIRGKEAAISGQLNSGKGLATLNGTLDWAGDEPKLQLKLAGEKLEFKQKPLFRAQVSPQLDLTVRPYYVDVKGSAKVENALVRPQTLSDKAIPLSADVRVVDLNAKDRLKIAKVMRQWDINADIELLLADNVLFQGFGLSSKLTGSLKLQQQKQRGMQAVGEIQLDKEAKYEAYGQHLQIRRGRVLFAGSIAQPALDIEAIKEVDSKVVGVRVEGRANAPTLTLFADSAMTQDEMLGYLLLGRPLYQDGRLNTGAGANDNTLLASAALSLGIKGGQGIANGIGNAIGVKDVTLDAEGSGDDTRFTVSGYLSPRLYLRYGVGVFTPVNKVTLRYKLNQSLYLEAVSSLESALDLFYNFKF